MELKPCPMCKSTNIHVDDAPTGGKWVEVQCWECGNVTAMGETTDDAVANWNWLPREKESKRFVFSVLAMNHMLNRIDHNVVVIDEMSKGNAMGKALRWTHEQYPISEGWTSHDATGIELPDWK